MLSRSIFIIICLVKDASLVFLIVIGLQESILPVLFFVCLLALLLVVWSCVYSYISISVYQNWVIFAHDCTRLRCRNTSQNRKLKKKLSISYVFSNQCHIFNFELLNCHLCTFFVQVSFSISSQKRSPFFISEILIFKKRKNNYKFVFYLSFHVLL